MRVYTVLMRYDTRATGPQEAADRATTGLAAGQLGCTVHSPGVPFSEKVTPTDLFESYDRAMDRVVALLGPAERLLLVTGASGRDPSDAILRRAVRRGRKGG